MYLFKAGGNMYIMRLHCVCSPKQAHNKQISPCLCHFFFFRNKCLIKKGEKHTEPCWVFRIAAALIRHQSKAVVLATFEQTDRAFFSPFHLLIEKECAISALRGGLAWIKRRWRGGGWWLMGKGTMVCGDTLMFNHKWPPPMPVLTSPFHYSSVRLSIEFIALPLSLSPQYLCKLLFLLPTSLIL